MNVPFPIFTPPRTEKLKHTEMARKKEEKQELPTAAIQQEQLWFTMNGSADKSSRFHD